VRIELTLTHPGTFKNLTSSHFQYWEEVEFFFCNYLNYSNPY